MSVLIAISEDFLFFVSFSTSGGGGGGGGGVVSSTKTITVKTIEEDIVDGKVVSSTTK